MVLFTASIFTTTEVNGIRSGDSSLARLSMADLFFIIDAIIWNIAGAETLPLKAVHIRS